MTEKVSGSFRDPSGFMFKHEGRLYRQVNQAYSKDYDLLMKSGLYEQLTKSHTLVTHHEADLQLSPSPELAYKVIQPAMIDFISYPYEWSFNQLKDAAILTLSIARRSLEFNMSLKDASAYNIQFHQGHPIFIDTLSFEEYQEGLPWVAYRQFCQHFLAPLALMAKKDIRLGQLLRLHIDGIPLDLTSRLLPVSAKLNFGLETHIHLHAKSQQRYADKAVPNKAVQGKIARPSLIGLIDSLLATVRGLKVRTIETEWNDYYQDNNYTASSFKAKRDIVEKFVKRIEPKQVWDMGGNTGEFSRTASDLGIPTICFDFDAGAVQQNYDLVKKNKEKFMLPLLMDLTNPSPALGWQNKERLSMESRGPTDLVMALALIHHLSISNNVPLADVATYFAVLGEHLIVEFVPKSDSQVQRLLVSRLDIFPDYNEAGFEAAFKQKYTMVEKVRVEGSDRTLYLMKRTKSTP